MPLGIGEGDGVGHNDRRLFPEASYVFAGRKVSRALHWASQRQIVVVAKAKPPTISIGHPSGHLKGAARAGRDVNGCACHVGAFERPDGCLKVADLTT